MDNSIQVSNRVFSKQTVSVDVNENLNSVSNEHDTGNIKNKNHNRRKTRITFKPPYVFLLFVLYQTVFIAFC